MSIIIHDSLTWSTSIIIHPPNHLRPVIITWPQHHLPQIISQLQILPEEPHSHILTNLQFLPMLQKHRNQYDSRRPLRNERQSARMSEITNDGLTRSGAGCGGTAAAAPPPFRPGNPALCGSYPLVTPYYCRLGDLLCFVFIVSLLYVFC